MTWRFHLAFWPWAFIGMAWQWFMITHTDPQWLLTQALGPYVPAWPFAFAAFYCGFWAES